MAREAACLLAKKAFNVHWTESFRIHSLIFFPFSLFLHLCLHYYPLLYLLLNRLTNTCAQFFGASFFQSKIAFK